MIPTNAKRNTNLTPGHCFGVKFQYGVNDRFWKEFWPCARTAIIRLFLNGSPTAILRSIISIAILAFKGFSFRSNTHVGQEILENTPSITHTDTTTTKPFIVRSIFVETAGNHSSPAIIGSGEESIFRMAVLRAALTNVESVLLGKVLHASEILPEVESYGY